MHDPKNLKKILRRYINFLDILYLQRQHSRAKMTIKSKDDIQKQRRHSERKENIKNAKTTFKSKDNFQNNFKTLSLVDSYTNMTFKSKDDSQIAKTKFKTFRQINFI